MNDMDDNRQVVVGFNSQMTSVAKQSVAASQQVSTSVDEQNNSINSIMQSSLEFQTVAERMHHLVERFTESLPHQKEVIHLTHGLLLFDYLLPG